MDVKRQVVGYVLCLERIWWCVHVSRIEENWETLAVIMILLIVLDVLDSIVEIAIVGCRAIANLSINNGNNITFGNFSNQILPRIIKINYKQKLLSSVALYVLPWYLIIFCIVSHFSLKLFCILLINYIIKVISELY